MKVTILALHLGYGGVEKYVITIANILGERHEVEILSTYKIIDDPAFPVNENVHINYLSEGLIPNKKELQAAIKNKKILMILKESIKSMKILYVKNKVNKKAIKDCDSDVIISTRDYHNKMIQKYANKNIIKITTEHNHPCGNKKYIDKVVSSCFDFDFMLPISRELTKFYMNLLPNVEVKYIPFCVDKPTYFVHPTFENPVYISVGRLSPEKGVIDLIDLFSKIVEKQKKAILHLIGDGNLMEQVKRRIHDLSLENNIIVHGYLRKEKIDELYCKSSIFLMASLTESFGFVLLEAMSCGLPCIAFDSAQGANEIIKDGVNGYLIKNRNVHDFVNKTINLFENQDLIKEMSQHALYSIEEYSYENTRKQWLNFFDEINNNITCK